ncbi:hypothetical protein [Cobetia sp. ICG0124]|uniref:hypothetical protein n=1 Tax=Cobetia sp. ICG0124 TaxID=2053669 RepID=UPI001F0C952B|nr:hypothetical protein [Cobetia sp. ICG0124]
MIRCEQVGFIEYDDICGIELFGGQPCHITIQIIKLSSIDYRQNAIDMERLTKLRIAQGVGDLDRIRDTAGFDDQMLGTCLWVCQQRGKLRDQVALHRAANTSIRQTDGGLGLADDQL